MNSFMRGAAAVLLAALLLGSSAAATAAQQRRGAMPLPAERGTRGFIMLGGSQLDIAELNTRLNTYAYPTFDDRFVQVGFTGNIVRDRWLLGVEAAGLTRPAATTTDGMFRTRIGAGYGMANIGYLAVAGGAVELYPKVGVGVGGVSVDIHERHAATFDEVLIRPGRGVNMTNGTLLIDGSLGLTYRVRPRTTLRGVRGIAIGIRAGYTHSVLHGEWTQHGGDIADGPAAGWGGPHAEIMIGRFTGRR